MHFKVYSKENCPYCDKVKRVVDTLPDATIETLTLDQDFSREAFIEKFGQGSTFPQVFIDEQHIGGSRETVNYILAKGLLTA